jgi:hypothetical protein
MGKAKTLAANLEETPALHRPIPRAAWAVASGRVLNPSGAWRGAGFSRDFKTGLPQEGYRGRRTIVLLCPMA